MKLKYPILILFLFGIIILQACRKEYFHPQPQQMRLKSQRMDVWYYNGWDLTKDFMVDTYHYDSEGRVAYLDRYYESKPDKVNRINYTYSGNWVHKDDSLYYFLNSNGLADSLMSPQLEAQKMKYDADGRLIEINYYPWNSNAQEFQYSKTEQIFYDQGDISYTTSDNGKTKNIFEHYSTPNTLKASFEKIYFQQYSNHLRKRIYSNSVNLEVTYLYTLNADGYVISEIDTTNMLTNAVHVDYTWEQIP